MSVLLESAPVKPPLVVARHRHLKWKALDPLEHILMVLCGISIIGFTSSVFIVVLAVGAAMLVFGIQNFFNDMGSYRAPSLIPLSTYTASVPISGALIVLL